MLEMIDVESLGKVTKISIEPHKAHICLKKNEKMGLGAKICN